VSRLNLDIWIVADAFVPHPAKWIYRRQTMNSGQHSLGFAHGKLVHSRRVRVLAKHLSALIPRHHTVLDVGCGDGLIDSLILGERADLRITGVDVMVRPAAHILVTAFDGRTLPADDHSVDTVLFCDVLHHTVAPVALLKEAARVARHSIVIKDHVVRGFLARPTLRFMDFVGNVPHGVVLPYNYLTQDEWSAAFQACGLAPVEVRHRLEIYPSPFDLLFGRGLHFVGRLEPVRRENRPHDLDVQDVD
jgi:SAM-dependent methyltransferase